MTLEYNFIACVLTIDQIEDTFFLVHTGLGLIVSGPPSNTKPNWTWTKKGSISELNAINWACGPEEFDVGYDFQIKILEEVIRRGQSS